MMKHDWVKYKAEFMAGPWVSVRQFLKEKGLSFSLIKKTKGWSAEKKTLAQAALDISTGKILQKDIQDILEMRKRQTGFARYMQYRAARKMKKVVDDELSPEDARRLMVSGLEEERKAMGAEEGQTPKQTLTQININPPKTNLDRLIEKLDYEGILKLIAELKRLGAGTPIQQAPDSSTGEVEEGETI